MSANFETATQVLHRIDQPIASATGLPNERYTIAESFEHDREHVVAPAWASLLFLDELPEPGYVLPINFMGLPLLATRDKQDTVRVFHNVCSHRGIRLAMEPCKSAGTIRCLYHSWTYGLDGELRGTPHIGGHGIHEHAAFDKSLHGLREIRSHAWLGTLFINLSGDAIPFDEYTSPIRDSWLQLMSPLTFEHLSELPAAGSMRVDVNANWKLAVENFLEAYHLPTIHPDLNRISPLRQHEYLDSFSNGAGQRSLSYHRDESHQEDLAQIEEWPANKAHVAEYPVLYPNTFFGIHADHVFVMIVQPTAHNQSTEHARIFYPGKNALTPTTQSNRAVNLAGWQRVFEEDVEAVERCQQGRASPAYGGGAFSPVMDEPTHHFHKWVAHKLARAN